MLEENIEQQRVEGHKDSRIQKKKESKRKIQKYGIPVIFLILGILIGFKFFGGDGEEKSKELLVLKNNYEEKIKQKEISMSMQIASTREEGKKILRKNEISEEVIFAYEKAFSNKDAINSINEKIKFIEANTERIKQGYINNNPDVRNLDKDVVKDLLAVIDQKAQKELAELKKAKSILAQERNIDNHKPQQVLSSRPDDKNSDMATKHD